MWLAAVAVAAGSGSGAELTPPSYGWALLKLLAALIVVCVLAYALLAWLRKHWGARTASGCLRLVDRLPLSPRHSVWLVEAAGRYYLLGTAEPGGVTRLAELETEEVTALLARHDGARAAPSFLALLRGARRRGAEPEERR